MSHGQRMWRDEVEMGQRADNTQQSHAMRSWFVYTGALQALTVVYTDVLTVVYTGAHNYALQQSISGWWREGWRHHAGRG